MNGDLFIQYARDMDELHDRRRQLARAARSGQLMRLAHGAYAPTDAWRNCTADERYLARVRSIARTRRNVPVLSHWSAAAVHGLPRLGVWPTVVETIVPPTSGARTKNGVVKHAMSLADADVAEVDGLLVTSISRTVLDIAATAGFAAAVTVADRALFTPRFAPDSPLTTREDLWDCWRSRMAFTGHARARRVIEFARTQAESPIESVSRVTMELIGCPEPVLQFGHFDDDGFIGYTDFCWPRFGAVAEADGDRKYLDPGYRGGRSAEQVVLDEKLREDRIRALPRRLARWRWRTASDPAALRAVLTGIGLFPS